MPFSFLSYSCSLHQCVRSTFKEYPHLSTSNSTASLRARATYLATPWITKKVSRCPPSWSATRLSQSPSVFFRNPSRVVLASAPKLPVCGILLQVPAQVLTFSTGSSWSPPHYPILFPTLSLIPSSKLCWLLAILPQHQADYQLRALTPLVLCQEHLS